MAFFYFNCGAATVGSGATAGAVYTDGMGASVMEVDGTGSRLPSLSVLLQRLAVVAVRGLGACPLLRRCCC